MLLDRLVTADPQLERLRLATRGTAAAVVAGAVLLRLFSLHRLPGTAAAVGVLVALWMTIQANDALRRARMVTSALLPLVAVGAVGLAALLGAVSAIAAPAAFVAVAFAGVWIRRYGPRGFALGMMAILALFFGLFLRVPIVDLPACTVAIAIGAAAAFAFHFYALPDDPRLVLAAATNAFRVRVRLIAEAIASAHARDDGRSRQRLRRELIALDRTALAIDALVAGDAFALDDEQRDAVRLALLDAEVAADQMTTDEARLHEARAATEHAATLLDDVRRAPRSATVDAPPPPGPQAPNIGGPAATTRQAVQVAAASASAIALGALIPPHQYFWALLSAFLMFNQTASSADARRRTIARIVGTVLGVGSGLLAIHGLHGDAAIEVPIALAGTFAALYTFRAAYWAFTFWLTIVIAMVYEFVGRPADQLLIERLIETIVGATCGGVVASYLLPLRTQRVVAVRQDEFAERLATTSRTIEGRLRSGDGDSPLAATRALDAAAQELIARARPLGDPPESDIWERAAAARAAAADALHANDVAASA